MATSTQKKQKKNNMNPKSRIKPSPRGELILTKDNHTHCRDGKRLDKIEADLKYEAQKQDELRNIINGKLDKIYNAIRAGDNQNMKYIFTTIGIFIGAIISLVGFIIAY